MRTSICCPFMGAPIRRSLASAWAIYLLIAVLLACADDAAQRAEELYLKGQELMNQKQWAEAATQLEKALALRPLHQRAAFTLSATYIEIGRYKHALDILMPLHEEFPKNPLLLNNLAWIYIKAPEMRDVDKGLSYARDAVLIDPSNVQLWSTLVEAYYSAGRYEQALRRARVMMSMTRDVDNLADFVELYERCVKAANASEILK